MCPRWPAAPEAPRRIAPSTNAAPPTPGAQGQQNHIALSPGGAPEHLRNQRGASVIIGIDRQSPGSMTSAKSRPSRKFRSPGRLFTRDVAVSIMPLHPMPIPQICGLACCKTRCTKSCRAAGVRGEGW